MGTKNNNDLFYTCSLIEYIGRQMKRTRKEVSGLSGKRTHSDRIYEFADVFTVSRSKRWRMSLYRNVT